MEANGAKHHHANHKKETKPKKEFVPHSRTKSYYGHPNPHPHSNNASGPSSQLSPSSSKQPVYQSTDSGTKFGLNSDHTHINNVNKITPVSKHEKTVPVKKDTLKVENLHVKRTDDPKESRKADAKKKTVVAESHKTSSETETNKKSKTNKKEDPGRTPVITVSSGNNYGSTQKAEHPTKNGNNQVLPTDKDLLQASEVQVNARQRPKIQLRRCASVDVAELHRKKKGKKHGKNKLDKDIFLVVSKAEPPVGDILQKDYINTHSQRSNSVGKRPNSLKLSADSNSKSQSIFPTPTLTAKRHSSISKEDKRAYSNAVAPAIEVYDRSPNQFVPQSSTVDRIKKISVDFSSLDEIPPGEGYRRHGLKHNFPSSPYLRIKTPEIHHVSLRMFGITVYSIAAFLVFCPTAAILLVLVPLCFFLKTLFKFCWCCCNRGQGQTCICCICGENLSLTEKFWIQNNHFNPKVVQSLIIVEYGLSTPQIVNLINTRLVLATSELDERLYPRFSQRVVRTCSDYVWVKDESFFIHDHVFAMPKGIESVVDLQDYVSDMGSRPLSFNSALWEVHILTNFGEQQDTVLLLRMHPCLTDGVSLVRVLYKSIADVDSVTTVPPKFAQVSCLDSFKSILYGPLMFFKTFVCSRNDFNLLHGKHIHLSGKKLITWSEPYSLSAAIRIKQVTRSTLSEVLMSVAAGSIRSYLQLNGIPHPYDMHCSIPVYVGADKASTFGNHVILLTIPIPTNTEGIVPRLWQMKEHMIKVKHSAFFAWTKRLFKCSFRVLPESLWNNMWRSVVNNCSCVISCLPGPEIGLRLASKQIKTIFYWYPHVHSIPLTISFFTYGDHVQMAVSADSSVLPNPEILTKDFIYQMEALSKLLSSRRIPGEHSSKKVDPASLSNEIQPEETVEEIQVKMSLIHQELQNLKHQLDSGKYRNDGHDLKILKKIENLKEQFREYLVEMRKRKAAQTEMAISLSEDDSTEDDDEFDIPRRPFRRRAMSVSSRLSTASLSSTIRPLTATTPGATPAITPDFSPDSPLIMDKQVPYSSYTREKDNAFRPYTVPRTHHKKSVREDFEILEYQYSPSVERRYKVKEPY